MLCYTHRGLSRFSQLLVLDIVGHQDIPLLCFSHQLFFGNTVISKDQCLRPPLPLLLRSLIPGSFVFCMSDFVSWDLRREVAPDSLLLSLKYFFTLDRSLLILLQCRCVFKLSPLFFRACCAVTLIECVSGGHRASRLPEFCL